MRGGSEDSKFSQFQIFPKFKKVQNFLGEGGGGKDDLGLFPFFGTFFKTKASLSDVPLAKNYKTSDLQESNFLTSLENFLMILKYFEESNLFFGLSRAILDYLVLS